MTRLKSDVYEYIKLEVVNLFEECGIRCVPISGFEIAHKLNIKLTPYSSLSKKKLSAAMNVSEDGFFVCYKGNETIFYNDSKTYKRVNMTILHEIGHCVLGHNEEMDNELCEAEAKFFAKYAAAPPPLVHKIQPQYPEEIMETFNISFEASVNAFNYYQNWKYIQDRRADTPKYERNLVFLFEGLS